MTKALCLPLVRRNLIAVTEHHIFTSLIVHSLAKVSLPDVTDRSASFLLSQVSPTFTWTYWSTAGKAVAPSGPYRTWVVSQVRALLDDNKKAVGYVPKVMWPLHSVTIRFTLALPYLSDYHRIIQKTLVAMDSTNIWETPYCRVKAGTKPNKYPSKPDHLLCNRYQQ